MLCYTIFQAENSPYPLLNPIRHVCILISLPFGNIMSILKHTGPHTYGNNISTLRQGIQCTISPSLVNRILDRDEPTEDFGDDDSSDWSITD